MKQKADYQSRNKVRVPGEEKPKKGTVYVCTNLTKKKPVTDAKKTSFSSLTPLTHFYCCHPPLPPHAPPHHSALPSPHRR